MAHAGDATAAQITFQFIGVDGTVADTSHALKIAHYIFVDRIVLISQSDPA